MATKTIDHLGFRIDVTPYEHEGNTFNRLTVSVGYQKGRGFYVTLHPVLADGSELYDFSRNPLSDTTWIGVEQATKNNSKRLTAIYENVKQGQEAVRLCFDARKWERMEFIIVNLAAHGYADWLKETVCKFLETTSETHKTEETMAKKQVDESPMMKQYRDLKAKHPGAMLLFRCGDFYETYEDDARECAKVLGITLTFRNGDKMPMAGFPHHALDTYLPRLIRAGKRVAICDPLPEPPKTKRGITETIGTTEDSNSTNNQNSEDEVMTNETMKVTDLIGKSVCNGNAKYVIKSVDGDKVTVDFAMGDNAAKEMNMKAEQIEKLLQGGWTVGDGTQEPTKQEAPKTEEPKAKTVKMEPESKPKAEKSAKPKVTLKCKQPQAEEPKGKLTYSTYTNAKGKACAKVSGFAETDAAYQQAVSLHGSATYENTKQGRVNFLLFGPRYAEVAKTVCQMLNEGKTVADCQAVVDRATEERAQKREERKQKREAYRQEHEGKAQTAKPQGKTYTEQEVADLMRRVIEGDKEAIAIVNAMAA